MSFSARLSAYIEEVGCTAKQLAEASTLSAAAISRYRTGERAPDPDGENLRLLAEGLASLSNGRLTAQAVQEDLAVSISGIAVDYDTFLGNLRALLGAIPVGNNELARALSFDPSYISRILAGQRRPADMQSFVGGIAQHVAHRAMSPEASSALSALMLVDWGAIEDADERAAIVAEWLRTNFNPISNPMGEFLQKFDEFDLDDFIRSIRFDEMKVPPASLQLPTTRTYTGLRAMMEAEIDYLKATVLSKSAADVIMYSDMPMQEMATDADFPKNWMFGMAMLLKKGLHLNIIHDTSRPLHEMLLGLESWIPMYMTGQISPYYFPDAQGSVFNTLLKVSGTVALAGEAVSGSHAEGRYVLTKNRDEVRYYRRRAERMLAKAQPLMRIMTAAEADEFASFEREERETMRGGGAWRAIMSTLPIGTIPASVLERVLEGADIPANDKDAIRAFAALRSHSFADSLRNSSIVLEVPDLTREEFAEHPLSLDLSSMFYEHEVVYGYDEYRAHVSALQGMFAQAPGCSLLLDRQSPFRNTQILICAGSHATISKSKSPVIHFVLSHPSMVSALEKFIAPVRD